MVVPVVPVSVAREELAPAAVAVLTAVMSAAADSVVAALMMAHDRAFLTTLHHFSSQPLFSISTFCGIQLVVWVVWVVSAGLQSVTKLQHTTAQIGSMLKSGLVDS